MDHVCPQALKNFVSKVFPTITVPFVLVTNNSDWTIPDDIQKEFDILIQSPFLVHWFSQNCIITHPKITQIPIGLDYHTLIPRYKKSFSWSEPIPIEEEHPCGWGMRKLPAEQEKELLQIRASGLPFWERTYKAYANFHFLMTTLYGKVDRVDAFATLSKDLVFYEPQRCTRDVCWKNMIQYAFVFYLFQLFSASIISQGDP